MPTNPAQEPTTSQPRLPAWVVSVVVHALILIAAGLFLKVTPRGATEEPLRSAGIILKHVSNDGERFEGEQDDGNAEAMSDTVSESRTESALDALPTSDAAAASAAALPSLPTLAPGGLENGGAGNATGMTEGGSGKPSGIGGGKARVRVFGTEGTGSKFVYVFDRSSSMEGTRLAAAKRELIRSLDSLKSTHQFHILFFNDRIRSMDLTGGQKRIAFASDRNKKLAARWVGGITADGGTDRYDPLAKAIRMQPDVIFFLTDDNTPMASRDLERLKKINRHGTTINTIEFGTRPAHGRKNFLVLLSEMSGGQYAYINTRNLNR